MQRVFSATSEASRDVVTSWSKVSEREFYEGDMEIEGDRLDFVFEKAISYPASLTRLTSRCSLGYRRTWRHIRDNKIGFRVIWFVNKGKPSVKSRTACWASCLAW